MRLLTRRMVLVEKRGSTYVADNEGDSDESRTLGPLQAAAGRSLHLPHRLRPRAGQKLLTPQGAMPRDGARMTSLREVSGPPLRETRRLAA
jgi:hypothetical protein